MIYSNDCWMKSYCKKGCDAQSSCNQNDEYCVKLFKLNYLFEQSMIPKNLWVKQDLRLDSSRIDENVFVCLSNVQKHILDFVHNGNNLYLYSSITGNGKTAWAIRLLQAYLHSIWYNSDLICKVLFINVPKYLLSIKDNISNINNYAEFIKNNVDIADIVVWDDIGTKVATSFEHENLLSIIDNRMNNSKSNIFTSNVSPIDFKNLFGDRLYSRVINFSTCLEFKGIDKRNLKVQGQI